MPSYLYLYGHSLCHWFMLLHFVYNAYLCQNKYYQHNKLPFLEWPLSFVLQRWVWTMAMCGCLFSRQTTPQKRWRRRIISCLLSIGSVVHNWSQRAFFFPHISKRECSPLHNSCQLSPETPGSGWMHIFTAQQRRYSWIKLYQNPLIRFKKSAK